jgi:hypothetical protein
VISQQRDSVVTPLSSLACNADGMFSMTKS